MPEQNSTAPPPMPSGGEPKLPLNSPCSTEGSDDSAPFEAANPAELQLYPRATMSERAARAIVPNPTYESDQRRGAKLLSAARLKQRGDNTEDGIRERIAIHQSRRWEREAAEAQQALEAAQEALEPSRSDDQAGTPGAVGGGSAGCPGGAGGAGAGGASGDGSLLVRGVARGADYLIHESNLRTGGKNADFDDFRQLTADRLDRLTKAKHIAVDMALHLESLGRDGEIHAGRSVDEYARDLRRCGSCLHFQEIAEIGESRMIAGAFCSRHLLCPFCAIRRSAKMLRRYAPLIVDVCSQRKLVPWLVTLTVKNGSDLEDRFEHLRACMSAMHKAAVSYRLWRDGARGRSRRYVEWSKVVGAVYAVEVTKNQRSGEWHPHVHYVAAVREGEELDHARLSEDWRRETGDSFVVDVRPFHCAHDLANITDVDQALDAMSGDLVEVLKYAVKFSTMPPADVWEAFRYISGGRRRLLGRCGEFFGWEVDENLLDAPLDTGDMPYVLAIARYINRDYVVERRTVHPLLERSPAPF